MWSPKRWPTTLSCASTAPRPRSAGPPRPPTRRRAFISGKQNTLKPTVVSDGQTAPCGPGRCARAHMHDQTAVKTEGIADLLTQHPGVKVRVDEGYRGLASAFAEQVTAPPRKPAKDAAAELVAAYRQARTEQSSRRICVEHAIAEHKHWRSLQLQRRLGRRESFGETDRQLPSFPPPNRLATLGEFPGLTEHKIEQLRALGRAAIQGQLDGVALRSQPPEESLAHLQTCPASARSPPN